MVNFIRLDFQGMKDALHPADESPSTTYLFFLTRLVFTAQRKGHRHVAGRAERMGTKGDGQDFELQFLSHRPRAVPAGREDVAAQGPLGVLVGRRQPRIRHSHRSSGRRRWTQRSRFSNHVCKQV